MAQTEAQRQASGAAIALLVVRRPGTSDVGEWWCFLTAGRLAELLGFPQVGISAFRIPARLTVADACQLLRAAGYGQPLDGAA